MRAYEMTFILAPTLEEEGLKAEIEAVKKLIAGEGGEVTAEHEWGRRKLAYPLQDHSEGVYHVMRFTVGAEGLKDLNRYIRLNDEKFLRHLIIKEEATPLAYDPSESEEYGDSRGYRGDRDRDRPRGRGRDDDDRPPRRDRGDREERPRREHASSAAGKEE
jgi:small subunit ribosomal protein S6